MVCLIGGAAAAQERIAEIRVHGNHTTPDEDIVSIADLKIGGEASDAALTEAARKLRASGRFADADVRRRYLSIADASQILVMIVVDERAAISDVDLTPGPMKRIRAAGMWLPIVSYADGYGFTYGARMTFVDPLGPHTRLSVPLTWGGEHRAGVELERVFGAPNHTTSALRLPDPASSLTSGRTLRVTGGVFAYRRVNPYYDMPDTRIEARVRAEHPLTSWLRVGGGARTAQVHFATPANAAARDRHDAAGADLIVDTRLDPSFPRNALYVSTGWERLRFDAGSAGRWTNDARGYVGLGSAVFSVRGQLLTSDASLPASERPLLGGADTLRGYAAGHATGDNLAALSAELRLPVNSPLSVGRFGVKGIVDWGTTWTSGARLADQPWDRGIGGGVYFGGGPVIADVAVAWPRHGSPRGHFGLGVSF